jgi:hypothetical protein
VANNIKEKIPNVKYARVVPINMLVMLNQPSFSHILVECIFNLQLRSNNKTPVDKMTLLSQATSFRKLLDQSTLSLGNVLKS